MAEETIGDLIAEGRCPECGTLKGIWHKMGCSLDPDAEKRLKPTPNSDEVISPQLIPDPRTDDSVMLYPHGGEREWSTDMSDEWKRALGVEMVRAELLAAERERSRELEEALHQIAAYTDCNGEWADWYSTGSLASHVHGKARNALEALSTSPVREGAEGG